MCYRNVLKLKCNASPLTQPQFERERHQGQMRVAQTQARLPCDTVDRASPSACSPCFSTKGSERWLRFKISVKHPSEAS